MSFAPLLLSLAFPQPTWAGVLEFGDADAHILEQSASLQLKGIAAADVSGSGAQSLLVWGPVYTETGNVDMLYGFNDPFNLDVHSADFTIPIGGDILSLGDANGDGFDDIAVFKPHNSSYFSGSIHIFEGPLNGALSLEDASGRILGDEDGLASRATALGDINGDGFTDIGTFKYETNSAQIYFGPFKGDRGPADADILLLGNGNLEEFGEHLDTGDLNGDGHLDLVVSRGFYSTLTQYNLGGVAVFYGPLTRSVYHPRHADLHFIGNRSGQGFDYGSVLPDRNGDGIDELSIGSHIRPSGFLMSPGSSALFYSPYPEQSSPRDADVLFHGTHSLLRPYEYENLPDLFRGMWTVGDLNGDGQPDLGAHARSAAVPNSDGVSVDGGAAYIFTSEGSGEVSSLHADVVIPGLSNDTIGFELLPLGDLDGDGKGEVAVRWEEYNGDQVVGVFRGSTLTESMGR